MKIAKQILQLTSIAFIAIGLSFILISGIVIGSQMSIGAETQLVNLRNKEQIRIINARYDYTIANAEQVRYEVENEWNATDRVWKAKDPAPDANTKGTADRVLADAKLNAERAKNTALDTQKQVHKQNQNTINRGGTITLGAVSNEAITGLTALPGGATMTLGIVPILGTGGVATSDLSKVIEVAPVATFPTNVTVKKAGQRFTEAFQATAYETSGGTEFYTTRLSPMGTVMVTGLALTLAGAGMIVAIIFINKSEGKKGSAKKAA